MIWINSNKENQNGDDKDEDEDKDNKKTVKEINSLVLDVMREQD